MPDLCKVAAVAADAVTQNQPANSNAAPHVVIRPINASDYAERDRLHDVVFGPGALTRTAYRVREGTAPHSPYCHAVWIDGQMIAMIRYTPVKVGGQAGAIMLGPLAVHPTWANKGYGRQLIALGHEKARADGVQLVLLVGDVAYYARLGFQSIPNGQILMPGPVDRNRLLALELVPGALARFNGVIAGD